MNKIFWVARREYIETIKTKFFLISIFLTPALIVAVMFVMRFMMNKAMTGEQADRNLVVLDLSGNLAADLQQSVDKYNAANPQRRILATLLPCDASAADAQIEDVKAEVREDKWSAALVVAKDAIDGAEPSHYYAKTRTVNDMELYARVQDLQQRAIESIRFRGYNLAPELVEQLRRKSPLLQVDVVAEKAEPGVQVLRLTTPFFFLFLMFMGLMSTSQGLLTSVIEEKNSRVMEVLLSAITPFQLMAGKILGLAVLSLSIVFLWGAVAYVTAASQGLGDLLKSNSTYFFVFFFLLGFLLYASVFAAIGSACNTIKEAQSLMTPVMIVLIFPMLCWFYIAQYPDSPFAVVLSLIPFTSPMIMILRLAARPDIPVAQVILSLVLLAAAVPGVMWAAAKVFRTGVLLYGKPPSFRELLRWIRYS
jgi:ABC-2 type transport system permease protein